MTMLDDLYQNVLDKVYRPDKEAIIKRRIRSAILFYHQKEQFAKDLVEVQHVFMVAGVETKAAIHQIDKQTYPRLRKVKYLVLAGDTGTASQQVSWLPALNNATQAQIATDYFEEIAVDRVLDGYGFDKQNVWYEAADFINLYGNAPFSRIGFGYYAYPVMFPDEALYSWIGKDYPDMIGYRVARSIFRDIGKVEDANSLTKIEIPEQELNFIGNQALIK